MSENQRRALRLMADRNTGAVLAGGRWVWRHDVRESEEAATEVCRVLTANQAREDG